MRGRREEPDRRAVAKDDQLPAVFRNLKPAPLDLGHEPAHARKPLHIPRLAPDHPALLHGFASEEVVKPGLG